MSLKIERLVKKYGSQVAVNAIDFEVQKGEIVGFLGPNGAGKSTTMKMITGYLRPNEGDVTLDDFSVLEHPDEIKCRIGYLPENNPLYHDMPVIDYLEFVARLQGVPGEQVKDRIRQVVEECGLMAEKHKKIDELSKGYRQRVGLAQAIIHDPELLILDEPTTGLDPNQIVEIRNLIKRLGKEKTVILSSHILSEVEATCDRILIISQGKLVADGTADILRQQAQGSELLSVQLEISNKEAKKALLSLASVEKVLDSNTNEDMLIVQSKPGESSRKPIFDLCKDKNWYLLELHGLETKLEDVFRNLTK